MALYFTSLGALAALNVAITEFINTQCKVNKSWLKQLISWIIPLVVSALGLVFGLGMFAEFGTVECGTAWFYTLLTGLGTGLVSNGIYDVEFVQQLINFIKGIKVNK